MSNGKYDSTGEGCSTPPPPAPPARVASQYSEPTVKSVVDIYIYINTPLCSDIIII